MSKLEGNGLWESSRMMLPEHKLELQRDYKDQRRRERIELDDQELEQVERTLNESLQLRTAVKVKLFDEYEQLEVSGVVERMDQYKRRFMVGGEWFWIVDVEACETVNNAVFWDA